MDEARELDVVLWGATGFTGRLVAAYLARRHRPKRWAIAGRDAARLDALAEALRDETEYGAAPRRLTADLARPESLEAMARRARVVLSTAGPFTRIGEPVVAACVRARTDYCDITGEPAFVDAIERRWSAPASDAGVRLVPCCGFDSVPADLGVWLTVRALPRGVPLRVDGYVHARGGFSGGTWQSALEAMAAHRPFARRARSESAPNGRRARAVRPGVGYRRDRSAWTAPLPTIDVDVVLRSARLLDQYGPDFTYGHHVLVRRFTTLLGGAAFVGATYAASHLGPLRRWLQSLRPAGTGPSPEHRRRSRFTVWIEGRGGGRRATTEIRGGDAGYEETAKMAAEAALCLALDPPATAHRGLLTPAVAMAPRLVERLRAAGLVIETTEHG
ncbi:MAG: saccharopine dehydrogenase NADP-binding domain-containing protein [Myxococcales bacterium]|nr:saccharopine dehydrogenase NADP-binding domain-containing protein [Myxococcales bacterium]